MSTILPTAPPIAPKRVREPFDDPAWIFEPKLDGFHALAYLEAGACRLVSRHQQPFTAPMFAPLTRHLAATLGASSAILDGELVCVDAAGFPLFNALLFRRGQPCYYAFDLRWLDGRDFRSDPLIERKRRLRRLLPRDAGRPLVLEHVVGRGCDLFVISCDRDLEGIVGKPAASPYVDQPSPWRKILNPTSTQKHGRHDLFAPQRSRRDATGSHYVA